MPRNLLLSFLGTGDYIPVSYYLAAERRAGLPPLEKYVQKTLLDHLAGTFGPGDRACIFVTEEARAVNWEPDGHTDRKTGQAIPNDGLRRLTEQAKYPFPVDAVSVNGESEPQAIWETFQTVYDQLRPGDRVYFDITHSWRYLPMLGMTLLNYAKVLRQIEVKAIYYGAFEHLGSYFEARQLPEDERPVPILDLVSFSDLQDWTLAADDFVRNGNPDRLSLLTNRNLTPILKESKGKDATARNLSDLTSRLDHLVARLATNRGQEIWEFDYQALHQTLDNFSAERSYIKPLNGVVDHIRGKVSGFKTSGNLQWLEGVNWCIQHKLVQQGLTQLQEGLLSWLCTHYEQKGWAEPAYFDRSHRNGRNLLSAALQFIVYAPLEEEWNGEVSKRKELAYQIIDDPLARQLAKVYRNLSTTRNDINHGGYTGKHKAEKFFSALKEYYATIRKILEQYAPEDEKTIGLLNISNHPHQQWPENQVTIAHEQFGPIRDLPFPNIDPQLAPEKLQELVSHFFEQVLELKPAAVHLMSEMTFTFALVQKLKAAGIPCVASTTQRLVTEAEGKKIVQFQFVQFRSY